MVNKAPAWLSEGTDWLTKQRSPDSSSAAYATGISCVPGPCLLLRQRLLLLLLLLIVVDAKVSACAGAMCCSLWHPACSCLPNEPVVGSANG